MFWVGVSTIENVSILISKYYRRLRADPLTSINDLCDRLLLLEKGRLLMDKAHVPGSIDPELEAYFLDAVK